MMALLCCRGRLQTQYWQGDLSCTAQHTGPPVAGRVAGSVGTHTRNIPYTQLHTLKFNNNVKGQCKSFHPHARHYYFEGQLNRNFTDLVLIEIKTNRCNSHALMSVTNIILNTSLDKIQNLIFRESYIVYPYGKFAVRVGLPLR